MVANKYAFFFQAEDGIRDRTVTGVQTCALPISRVPGHVEPDGDGPRRRSVGARHDRDAGDRRDLLPVVAAALPAAGEIGRASCRERVWIKGGDWAVKEKVDGSDGRRHSMCRVEV